MIEEPLGNYVYINGGYAFKSSNFVKEGIPIIRISNLTNGKLNLENCVKYPVETFDEFKRYLVEKGDILIAMSGATTGKVGVVNEFKGKGFFNQRVGNFKIKNSNRLNKKFLYYIVTSKDYQKKVKKIAAGCAQPNISSKKLEEIEVNIPPLKTQQKIVEILEKAEKLKEWRAEADVLTDEYLKSVFLEMFGDPVKNPHNFEKGRIKDLVLKTQYGTSKKANENNEGIPILRMNNITYEGYWDLSNMKYIELNENEKDKYLVKKGELLFNRTNSKELVGKSAVYKEDQPMAFAGYLVKLIVESPATSEFIAGHLNSAYGKSVLFNMAKSIVGMANINAKEVQKVPILLPPLEIQEEYAEIVKKVEQIKAHQKQSKQQIDNLFNNLMQKAFKGELTC
jgi:type I restriction enzyme, S subunit